MEDDAMGVLNVIARLRSDGDAAAAAKEKARSGLAQIVQSIADVRKTLHDLSEHTAALRSRSTEELSKQDESSATTVQSSQKLNEAFGMQIALQRSSKELAASFQANGVEFREMSKSLRQNVQSEIDAQRSLADELVSLQREDKDLMVCLPRIAKERAEIEKELSTLVDQQRIKTDTLNEAKGKLETLKAQRIQANNSVQELQEALDAKRSHNDEVNHSLSVLKTENAKLRLAVCPSSQKAAASSWAGAGPTPRQQKTPLTICNTPVSMSNGVEAVSATINDDIRESSASSGMLDKVSQQQRLLEEFNRNRHGMSLLQEANCSFKTGRDLLLEDDTAPNSSRRSDSATQLPSIVQDSCLVSSPSAHSSSKSNMNTAMNTTLALQSAKRPRFDLSASSIDGVIDDGNSSDDSLDEILNFNPFSPDVTKIRYDFED